MAGVHGVDIASSQAQLVEGGHTLETLKNASGRDVIEHYRIIGMGHGTPIDATTGYCRPGAHMLNAGISSTVHIARAWGLTPSFARQERSAMPKAAQHTQPSKPDSIQEVIEGALRAAGLMK